MTCRPDKSDWLHAWICAVAASLATALPVTSSSSAVAASILASATRTTPFASTSKAEVPVPLKDNGTTELLFMTTVNNQVVKITYNAECVVTGTRGKWVSVRILVDNVEADPASGHDFALCTAVDKTGSTWIGAARQSVFKVPMAGMHTVKVLARLNVGFLVGSGTWRLDDSSLVVETSVVKSATRTVGFQSTAAFPNDPPAALPLKQNGGKTLTFTTGKNNQLVRFSYNAECDLVAPPAGQFVDLFFSIDGGGGNPGGLGRPLCNPVDTTGRIWFGAVSQFALKVPTAGDHTLSMFGILNTGAGTWQFDDTSIVVESGLRASALNNTGFDSSSTAEVPVPLTGKGAETLTFKTAAANQLVTIAYSALCRIAAPRGRWVSIRVVVDGQEAHPASGHDFALCSSLQPGIYNYVTALRQSVVTVPLAGDHTVQIFAKASAMADWGLHFTSLVVK